MYDKYLSNKSDQLPEMGSLLVRVRLEYLTDAIKMVPLLEEFFLVCWWVSFDEILELRKIRRE